MLGAAALPLLLAAAAAGAAEPTVRYDLRPDGVPVLLAPQTAASFDYPFKPFPTSFVEKAKATSVDWQLKGAVTPAKDQGADFPLDISFSFSAQIVQMILVDIPHKQKVNNAGIFTF